MREKKEIDKILCILKEESEKWESPVEEFIKNSGENDFQVLISTVLSSRTKDETTSRVSKRLFRLIKTPDDVIRNSDKLAVMIYPVGFYRTKAKRILEIAKILKEKYNNRIPATMEELISLPGVGRKTANIVLNRCFGQKTIAVDTHVHRISNRLGFVTTKKPSETESELRKVIDKRWWKEYNRIMVAFGQKICHPVSPFCSKCPVEAFCPKMNVKISR
ncbi:MAG: endonuclease III domain-containing protein [Brevinematia bacterium]